ncbi:hypothetical protein D3C71_1441170 [compost metagenome]
MSFGECIGKAAADQNIVSQVQEVVDNVDFVLNLGTADDGSERTLRVRKSFAQYGQFLLHQKTGYSRQEVSDTFSRSMRTVSRAERVIYEQVSQFSELLSQFRIVLFFTRIETDILKHKHIAIVQFSDLRFNSFADSFISFGYRLAEQLGQTFSCTGKAHRINELTLRTAHVAGQNDLCTVLNQVFNRWKCFADAGIIGDLTVFHWHVEIYAYKYAFACYFYITDAFFVHD